MNAVLTQPQRDSFARDGFLKLRVFEDADIKALENEFFGLMASGGLNVTTDPVQSRANMAAEYAQEEGKRKFKSVITLSGKLLSLGRFFSSSAFADVLRQLGLPFPVISSVPEIRTDFPRDSQYMQNMHQDWPYTQSSLNAITAWTPLHDVEEEDGALLVAPGSHKMGIIDPVVEQNPRKFLIPMDALGKLRPISVPCKRGETIIFNQLLVHGSGTNVTNRMRLSFQVRIADAENAEWKNSAYFACDKNQTTLRKLAS